MAACRFLELQKAATERENMQRGDVCECDFNSEPNQWPKYVTGSLGRCSGRTGRLIGTMRSVPVSLVHYANTDMRHQIIGLSRQAGKGSRYWKRAHLMKRDEPKRKMGVELLEFPRKM